MSSNHMLNVVYVTPTTQDGLHGSPRGKVSGALITCYADPTGKATEDPALAREVEVIGNCHSKLFQQPGYVPVSRSQSLKVL